MGFKSKIADLVKESEYFQLRRNSSVADLMLWGFARDAIENGTAVACLMEYNPYMHLSYANARCIFESAQNACCLATNDDYKDSGFKAWFYFLNKDRKWVSQFVTKGFERMGYDNGNSWMLNETAALSSKIRAFSPAEADDLLSKYYEINHEKNKRPDNWLGKNMANAQAEAYKKFNPQLALEFIEELIATNRSIYSRMCRDVHAGLDFHNIQIATMDSYGLMVHSDRDNEVLKESISILVETSLVEIINSLKYAKKLTNVSI